MLIVSSRALVAAALFAIGCNAAMSGAGSDAAPLDMSVGGTAEGDMAVGGDVPDLAVNVDLAASDLSMPDLSMPDLRPLPPPIDMALIVDATMLPDLSPPPVVTPVVHQLSGVIVATLAGSSVAGSMDGTGAAAQLDNPVGLALDGSGLLYVTEYDGNRIRTVDGSGVTHTITTAASGGASTFNCPFAITFGVSGQLVVQTDCDPSGIKSATSGTLWRVDIASGVPTPAVQGLGRPRGLAFLDLHHVAVSDRTVETLSTLASTESTLTFLAGGAGDPGYIDDNGSAARFDGPYGLALLPGGSVVVADTNNNRLRAVTSDGTVTTIAGGPQYGLVDGTRADSRFSGPTAVAVDAAGEVFVSDPGNHRIRRVAADGTVTTVAGDGSAGFEDGTGVNSEFYGQEGIAVTPDGKTVYVADGNDGDGSAYHRIRVISLP